MKKETAMTITGDIGTAVGYVVGSMIVGTIGTIIRRELNDSLTGKIFNAGIYIGTLGASWIISPKIGEGCSEMFSSITETFYELKEDVKNIYVSEENEEEA